MNKSLKKLNRMELLQLLVEASETNDALIAENSELRREAIAAREQQRRQRRPVQVAKVGSIAEAALQANGYFEAAQKSADDYLREIKRLRDQVAARTAGQPGSAPVQTQEQIDAEVKARVQEYRLRLQEQMKAQLRQQRAQMQAQINAQQEQINAQAAQLAHQGHQPVMQVSQVREQQAGHASATVQEAQKQANLVISQANVQAQAILANARSKSDEIISDANKQAGAIIEQANRRADVLINAASKADDQHSTGPIARKGRHVKMAAAVM